jgi:hypothetical protein
MTRKLLFIAVGCASLLAGRAKANTYNFITPPGASVGDASVNASATFETGSDTLRITLSDLLANPTSVRQLISDITFAFDSSISPSGARLISAAGTGITVGNNGRTSGGTVPSDAWELNGFHLSALGDGQPRGLIIGPAGAGGLYTSANGSIAGNNAHNPFYAGSATFVLSILGVTPDTVVNSATFSFGTTEGINVTAVLVASVPDVGTTVLLLAAALSGLGFIRCQSRVNS